VLIDCQEAPPPPPRIDRALPPLPPSEDQVCLLSTYPVFTNQLSVALPTEGALPLRIKLSQNVLKHWKLIQHLMIGTVQLRHSTATLWPPDLVVDPKFHVPKPKCVTVCTSVPAVLCTCLIIIFKREFNEYCAVTCLQSVAWHAWNLWCFITLTYNLYF